MSYTIGTPGTADAVRLILLGSGELGREVALEAMRMGCEVLAVDRYADAPAMQIAHRSIGIDMTDAEALRGLLTTERARPHGRLLVVPEIEAIATDVLVELEADGLHIVPTARAARLTMDREGIRRLAAQELRLPTSPYRFCSDALQVTAAVAAIGVPCVVKPLMSSSGKGQSVVRTLDGGPTAWATAQAGTRAGAGAVIVEGLVDLDEEITLLTVRHAAGTSFCAPIGHLQVDGDYRESWQPQGLAPATLARAREIATQVTDALGGYGVFGVELFVCGDEVLFSEVSPRPHDTGMVTMATQVLSEFALHVRAILGLPVPAGEIPLLAPAGASAVILGTAAQAPLYEGMAQALATHPSVSVRLFGKPEAPAPRRLGVTLATAGDVVTARARAVRASEAISVR